jgi:hypothetical protein
MDEMLDAIQAEVTEDPPTTEVETFFKLLKASEESLNEHTEVTILAFITRLIITVVHICLAAHGRTPHFRAHATKGRSMLS